MGGGRHQAVRRSESARPRKELDASSEKERVMERVCTPEHGDSWGKEVLVCRRTILRAVQTARLDARAVVVVVVQAA
jgi:hypothetical protein